MIELQEMRILIADDMDSMRRAIHGMLKVLQIGKTYYLAANGLDAWEILQKQPVDLALLDWNMPEMRGVELLSRIREDRRFRELPVVMITGEANQEIVAEAAETEIDAYLLKPVTTQALSDRIHAVIDKANNPPPMLLHLRRSRTLEEDGDIAGALTEARQAMAAEPQSTRPIREIGRLYLRQGKLDEAEKWLLKAAELNELDVVACHLLGDLYLKREEIDLAARFFDRAMKISPRNVDRGVEFGRLLVKKGMAQRAFTVFRKAFEVCADPVPLQEEVAEFCLDQNQTEYAIKLMQAIIGAEPERNDVRILLGKTYEQQGDHKQAIKILSEAAEMDKDNLELKLSLARGYIALGWPMHAERFVKAVLAVQADHPEARELLKSCV